MRVRLIDFHNKIDAYKAKEAAMSHALARKGLKPEDVRGYTCSAIWHYCPGVQRAQAKCENDWNAEAAAVQGTVAVVTALH
eukprot:1157296-Pelagomonas_calceolata.AAC.11